MPKEDDIGSFIRENKEVLKEYFETRYEIMRLKGVRSISKTAGYLTWIVVSLLLGLLVIIFGGLTMAYWLSQVFGNLVAGFGVTTLIIVLLLVVLAAGRKQIFINPVIRSIIRRTSEDE